MAAGDAVGRYRGTVGRSKDPSGLLISVIRTLSTSDDVEDRENEKGRLEEAYEKCDRDLDELIVQHYTELTTAIRTYQSITERITNSRNKIRQVKENLLSCKMLLHCKRDELRKLWIEGIEHKHVLNLLDEIENIKQVPQKLEQCMASKRYLNATDMLVSAVDSLEGPLLQVEGLSDLRLELHSKKMNLHLVLIDELHRHLYIKSTNRVGQRGKDRARLGSLVKDASPVPLMDVTNLSTPRKFLETSQFSTPGSSSMRDSSLLEIKEDTDLDPEENSAVFMGILIKGLAKLKKIPETVKAIQDRLEQELKQIVKRSTTQVADSSYQRGENISQENQPRLLLELLELLFDKFNAVAAAHSVVLGHLQQTVASPCSQHDGDIKLYDMVDVWVKIQDVLQMLLTEYLDMKNTRTASEPSAQLSYASSGREFAAFFAKKKPQRPKNPLFKFESSSHAISMSAYLREQRRELYSRSGELQGGPDDNLIEGGGSKFVCKPGARNITIIFHPLLRFIQEIEFAMELGPAKQCPLREFLTMYIKNIFLNQVLAEINKEIEGVTKASDPLKILANADTMKVLGVQRPLLHDLAVCPVRKKCGDAGANPEESMELLQGWSQAGRDGNVLLEKGRIQGEIPEHSRAWRGSRRAAEGLGTRDRTQGMGKGEIGEGIPGIARESLDPCSGQGRIGQRELFNYFQLAILLFSSYLLTQVWYLKDGFHFNLAHGFHILKIFCQAIIFTRFSCFILPNKPGCSSLCRQYYEMLYNTADELLNLVVDQGVKYTELEYIYALNLLHRSQTGVGDQTTQNMRLQRLKEIICEQAAIKQATKDKKITTV
uniref:Exocyst complex component Sec8 n=1 Tax=Catharus ustulatus TaxID=91951 RepID=A0A8C3V866_CATUS